METSKCPLTLQLEDLTPPKFFLPEFSPEQIVQSDKHWKKGFLCSSLDKKLFFTSKQNPVILDFVKAYKDHRPIILSPDIIWLLIVQGFSHHVYNNSEELRHHFVNFDGRKTL